MAHRSSRRFVTHDMIRARLSRQGLVRGAAAGGAGMALGGRFGGRAAFAQTPTPPQVDPTADEPEVQLPLAEEKTTLRVLQVQNPTVENCETSRFHRVAQGADQRPHRVADRAAGRARGDPHAAARLRGLPRHHPGLQPESIGDPALRVAGTLHPAQ